MLFKDHWPFVLESWATRYIRVISRPMRIGTRSVCHVIGGSNSVGVPKYLRNAPLSHCIPRWSSWIFPRLCGRRVTVYIMSATSGSRRPEIHFNFRFRKNLVITNLKEILSFVPTRRSSLRKLWGKYRKFHSISQPWPRLLSKSSFFVEKISDSLSRSALTLLKLAEG